MKPEELEGIKNETLRALMIERSAYEVYNPDIHVTPEVYGKLIGNGTGAARKMLDAKVRRGELIAVDILLPSGHTGKGYIKQS